MISERKKKQTTLAWQRSAQVRRGKPFSEEHRKRLSSSRKAHIMSDEHKKNISLAHLKSGIRPPRLKGHKFSPGTVAKRSGENHYKWRGGITKESTKIRTSKEYALWRTAVFQRDNYTCVWCGARSAKSRPTFLNADHIKPFAYFPELRLAIDNGRTLCTDCHKKTDNYGWRGFWNELDKRKIRKLLRA